jgi:hypothetical protein
MSNRRRRSPRRILVAWQSFPSLMSRPPTHPHADDARWPRRARLRHGARVMRRRYVPESSGTSATIGLGRF